MKYLLIISFLFPLLCEAQDREPPGQFEIMKWYWNGVPKSNNGWSVEMKEISYLHGDTEGVKHDMVSVTCDTCNYLVKYSFDVLLIYGYGDKTSLTVIQNKDTTDKYFKIMYPEIK